MINLPNINWTEIEILNFFGLPKDTPVESESIIFSQGHQILVYKSSDSTQYGVFIKTESNDYLIENPNNNFPSVIDIYPSTDVSCIKYYNSGRLHRANKPAVLMYVHNYLVSESFYFNGKMHNKHGPAYRYRDDINSRWYNSYCINGQPLSKNQFFERYNVA